MPGRRIELISDRYEKTFLKVNILLTGNLPEPPHLYRYYRMCKNAHLRPSQSLSYKDFFSGKVTNQVQRRSTSAFIDLNVIHV